MTELHISLPVKPIPLKRHRTRFGHTYDPQAAVKRKFADLVRIQHPTLLPLDEPLEVEMIFEYKMPKTWSKKKQSEYLDSYKDSKADLDNLCKFCLDALNSVVWKDDACVCSLRAKKRWSYEDSITIRVISLADES